MSVKTVFRRITVFKVCPTVVDDQIPLVTQVSKKRKMQSEFKLVAVGDHSFC